MFIPLTETHAIQSVAIAVRLGRAFDESAMAALEAEHKKFRTELPKVERQEVFQFAVGFPPGPPPPVTRPIAFSAFRRDGSIDWQMKAEENALLVNCLSYTRWADVSVRATSLLSHAAAALRPKALPVTNVILQYLDVFRWSTKTSEYDLGLLLRPDSPYVPASVYSHKASPLWHLHQGAYVADVPLKMPGRLLERVHLDAALENGSYIVRVETFLQLDLASPTSLREALFDRSSGHVTDVLNQMHHRSKELLLSHITDELAERIGLRVSTK
ncbi:TIGR04255 family protein [Mesorhizobium sp. M0757]|uniref:TIGR04255 family protein n=1 Tax=Mesorhizobium sp. M0757 TaxID=2956993 RepID=UPI003334F0ED